MKYIVDTETSPVVIQSGISRKVTFENASFAKFEYSKNTDHWKLKAIQDITEEAMDRHHTVNPVDIIKIIEC